MNLDNLIPRLIAGAVSGMLAAVVVDVNAWSKAGGTFKWDLAVKRWVSGAVTGAVASLGLGTMQPVGSM